MSDAAIFANGRKAMLVFGLAALVPMVVHAVGAGTPANKDTTKTPATTLPPTQPKSPTVRRSVPLTRQTPFSAAIDILRNSTTPPLNIIVLWKQIESVGVYRETPIGFDGVPGLRAGQYLDLLTLSLSAGASAKLGYSIDNGTITISTADALPKPKLIARLYDISDLVAPPARYAPAITGFGMGMGYGGPMMPFGGAAMNPGAGSYGLGSTNSPVSTTGSTYGAIAQPPRAYRNR